MERIKLFVIQNLNILIVFASAVFLRFFRLGDFAMFLSDQGRDAIIIKRIVTLQHFPAIGASSSVGQVYLGPFYYYLVALFLPLFHFNPVGLAFGVALLSIVGIVCTYLIIKKEFNEGIGLFLALLITFSFVNIEVSRFSWNPNLLPFFSFIMLYFFYKFLTGKKIIFSVLFGTFFSFCFQLHYLSGLLILPIALFFILELIKHKEKIKLLGRLFVAIASFVFFSFPLVIFDVRHNFLNVKNLIKLFTEQGVFAHSSYVVRLSETIQSFFSFTFISNVPFVIGFFILLLLFGYFFAQKKLSLLLKIHMVTVVTYLLGFALLTSSRHAHYYHSIYLSFFLIVSYVLYYVMKKSKMFLGISIIILMFYIGVNISNCYFLFQKPTNQIKQAETVAQFLAEKIDHKPFNISTWPVEFFEDSYLYFLELGGLVPADRSKVEITNQMFVLCSKEPCQIINSPSWNISMFGKAKIDKIWEVEGIKIYRLIHPSSET